LVREVTRWLSGSVILARRGADDEGEGENAESMDSIDNEEIQKEEE
jgi:hypothetical protein